jgi:DNA-binding transcriptional LysR family regulator
LRDVGGDPRQAIELGSIEAIKELLKISLGVGIMAPWVAAEEIAEGSLKALPMGNHKIERTWGIACTPGKKLSLSEETFVGLCRATCESLSLECGGLTIQSKFNSNKRSPGPDGPRLRTILHD